MAEAIEKAHPRRSRIRLVLFACAAVALLAERFLPGVWYILLGGIAGTAVGALRREPGR